MKIILALLFVSSLAQAGIRDVGNGGRGVLINDKPYLLDLYEVGVLAPEIDYSLKSHPSYAKALQGLSILNAVETEMLAKKLSEIRTYSPVVADRLAAGISMYMWRVLDQELVEIPEASPIVSPYKQVQLANRLDFTIRLNKKYWDRLDSVNKVALVIHEIFYAYSETVEVTPGIEEQVSIPVRALVGYVFSPELKIRGRDGLANVSGISWAPARLRQDGNIELLRPGLDFIAEKVTFGNVSASGDEKYIASQCSQVEKRLKRIGRSEIKFTLSYGTALASISFVDYTSPSGPQKKLEYDEPIGTQKYYPFAEITFNRGNIETCSAWIKSQVQKYGQYNEFPQLPE
ncbi:hypothetical protein [Bdellovibrio sp. HCB337]|uniref:hypothetical protein n=1 Tax=Bdellovibrio sp. HCB337 TaxID=3394358 RepID=UPI0039A5D415